MNEANLDDDSRKRIIDIDRRVANLETHLLNLVIPIQSISRALTDQHVVNDLRKLVESPILIDDRQLVNLINSLKNVISDLILQIKSFDNENFAQAMSEIKYIGNRLKEIESTILDIQAKGVQSDIKISITKDGRKIGEIQEIGEEEKEEEERISDENVLSKIMDRVAGKGPKRRQYLLHVINHGNSIKTSQIAKEMKVTPSRIYSYRRGIEWRLRDGSTKKLLKELSNSKTKRNLLGLLK